MSFKTICTVNLKNCGEEEIMVDVTHKSPLIVKENEMSPLGTLRFFYMEIYNLRNNFQECSLTTFRKNWFLCLLHNVLNHWWLVEGLPTHHTRNFVWSKNFHYTHLMQHYCTWEHENMLSIESNYETSAVEYPYKDLINLYTWVLGW